MRRNPKVFICVACQSSFEAFSCVSKKCPACRAKPEGYPPQCACGCGKEVAWKGSLKKGSWRKYVLGHHLKDKSRPERNYGFKKGQEPHNKGNRAYSCVCENASCSKAFRSSYRQKYCSHDCYASASVGKEGWHRGLTKQTNESLAALGVAVSASRDRKPPHNKGKNKDTYDPLKKAGEQISVSLSALYASGMEHLTKGVCGWLLNKSTGTIEFFQSSYEACYMHLLNERGLSWTKRHGIVIPYQNKEDQVRRYIPDFWIEFEHGVEVHEVKAAWLKEEDNNKRKFQEALNVGEQRGFTFRVLTEQDHPAFSNFEPHKSEWFVKYVDRKESVIDESEV